LSGNKNLTILQVVSTVEREKSETSKLNLGLYFVIWNNVLVKGNSIDGAEYKCLPFCKHTCKSNLAFIY